MQNNDEHMLCLGKWRAAVIVNKVLLVLIAHTTIRSDQWCQ